LASRNMRSTDIEITAAGIADENVSPTFSPRKTFEAVNTTVIRAPTITPRTVSSGKVIESGTRAGWVMDGRLRGSYPSDSSAPRGGGRQPSGSAVWYLTCFNANPERILRTP